MQFLMERLAYPKKNGQTELFNMKAAVVAQIQRIVSTRTVDAKGTSGLLDFGMPNVVELSMSSKMQLELYGARLGRLILQYEPRLLNPKISVEATRDPLMPYQLVVTGCLIFSQEPQLFHFNLPLH